MRLVTLVIESRLNENERAYNLRREKGPLKGEYELHVNHFSMVS